MRAAILVIAIAFFLFDWGGHRMPRPAMFTVGAETRYPIAPSPSSIEAVSMSASRVDFDSQIKPILQSKCMPCHFPNGSMYAQLPFDRPETVKKLGTKLFTRIRDENH